MNFLIKNNRDSIKKIIIKKSFINNKDILTQISN